MCRRGFFRLGRDALEIGERGFFFLFKRQRPLRALFQFGFVLRAHWVRSSSSAHWPPLAPIQALDAHSAS